MPSDSTQILSISQSREHPLPGSEDNEGLVKVENVGKIFCADLKRSLRYGLADSFRELLPGHPRKFGSNGLPVLRGAEFWANQDISFELRRGECLGLIGHNGAGKTTLLKMLNGLIKPDTGSITIRGRVVALIALGAGFNPILTGRENVYVNGSVLGLSKQEIGNKFDEIVDFAEIEEFIDMPVRSYSSGMQVRLGFAVATAMKPDVLLLDEVLAVGDAGFRQKSMQWVKGFLDKNGIGIFVSHNQHLVQQICSKVLFLERGIPLFLGDTEAGQRLYIEKGRKKPDSPGKFDGDVEVDGLQIREIRVNRRNMTTYGEPIRFVITVSALREKLDAGVGFSIWDREGKKRLFTLRSDFCDWGVDLQEGENWISAEVKVPLVPNQYCLKGMIFDRRTAHPIVRVGFEDQPTVFTVTGSPDDPHVYKQVLHEELLAVPVEEISWARVDIEEA